MYPVLFFIFAGLAVAGAISLLVQRQPIYSALSLVAVMGALAALYLLLGAEFVAAIQIIVYAGAIMVLFVFVIMLLNAQPAEAPGRSRVARALGYPLLGILIAELGGMVAAHFQNVKLTSGEYVVHVAQIGDALFRSYLLPFEATSILFLAGILGAVLLAAHTEDEAPGKLYIGEAPPEPNLIPYDSTEGSTTYNGAGQPVRTDLPAHPSSEEVRS